MVTVGVASSFYCGYELTVKVSCGDCEGDFSVLLWFLADCKGELW